MRTLALLLSVSLLACGGSQQTTAVPSPAAPIKPTRPPKSGVFFVVAFEALLPVGCYDAKKKTWTSGEACFDLLPDEPMVRLESGRSVKAGGWRHPTITDCKLTTALLMFEDSSNEKPGTFAVWPENLEARRIAWEATKKGAETMSADERDRLGIAFAKLAPTSTVSVVQVASADLDGDGESEVLYSLNGAGFDPASRKGLSALLFGGPSKKELDKVRSSDHAVFRVEGVVDVDDDGRSEVWISERTYHENGSRTDSMALARLEGDGMMALDPIESCWPPAKAK